MHNANDLELIRKLSLENICLRNKLKSEQVSKDSAERNERAQNAINAGLQAQNDFLASENKRLRVALAEATEQLERFGIW